MRHEYYGGLMSTQIPCDDLRNMFIIKSVSLCVCVHACVRACVCVICVCDVRACVMRVRMRVRVCTRTFSARWHMLYLCN